MSSSQPTADTSRLERKEVGLAGLIGRVREQPWMRAASKAAKLGDQTPLYALAGTLTGLGLALRRPAQLRAGLRMAAAVAAADALKSLTKQAVARSRPNTVLDQDRYVSAASDGGHGKPEQSFPSGHVACSVAAGLALTRVAPGLGPAVAVGVAALGVTRVLGGDHWPSDVAAGLVVGATAERATAVLAGPLERRLGLSSPRRRA